MLQYAIISDPGSRKINEDAVAVFQSKESFGCVLCDGLGGHGMGDIASSIVKSVFTDLFYKTNQKRNFLDTAFCASQDILMMEQRERNATNKMKTTAVSMVTDGKDVYIGHIGDSRLYVFHKNKVKMRTIDHSVPQMLALSGDIKESEIRFHKDRNIVLRVLGIEWEDERYELEKPIRLKKCQAFLLCSDGFWELIDEDEMCTMLKSAASVDEWLNMMTAAVKRNGSGRNMDNYSAIAVWNT